MLDETQIKEVKEEFIGLVNKLATIRKDVDVENIVKTLEDLNFFMAPASKEYHCSFPGGLCLHSINVYKTLKKLIEDFAPGKYNEASILIVSLFHDVIRANLFDMTAKNEKVYSNYGKKDDRFIDPVTNKEVVMHYDWKTSLGYATKPAEDRLTYGSRGFASYFLVSNFIPMTEEETITIVNQYSAFDNANVSDITTILSKYNLATFLHVADVIATYCIEK